MTIEIFHRDDGDQFKLGRMIGHRFCVRADRGGDLCQLIVRNEDAIQLHALIETVDIGGDVESGLISRQREYLCEHCGGGTLAVCSGNVDKLEFLVWIADARE